MRTRILLAALFLLAACGESGPTPQWQPLEDSPQAATEAPVTTTTASPNLHPVDLSLRNPFEPP